MTESNRFSSWPRSSKAVSMMLLLPAIMLVVFASPAQASCFTDSDCRNGGTCSFGTCLCTYNYYGTTCQSSFGIPSCSTDSNCKNGGTCTLGTCLCTTNYYGDTCQSSFGSLSSTVLIIIIVSCVAGFLLAVVLPIVLCCCCCHQATQGRGVNSRNMVFTSFPAQNQVVMSTQGQVPMQAYAQGQVPQANVQGQVPQAYAQGQVPQGQAGQPYPNDGQGYAAQCQGYAPPGPPPQEEKYGSEEPPPYQPSH